MHNLENAVAQYKVALANAHAEIENAKILKMDRQGVCDEEDRKYDNFNQNKYDFKLPLFFLC